MRIPPGLEPLANISPGAVVAIGNYDGVHLGHQAIIARAKSLAGTGRAVLITFEPHPLTVVRPEKAPPRISSVHAKLRELGALVAAGDVCVLSPTRELLDTSAADFWALLRDVVRPRCIVEGASFTFGRRREGTVDLLLDWSRGGSIQVDIVPQADVALPSRLLVGCSSSLIRWFVHQGRVQEARCLLGRPFCLSGKVIHGHHRGRTIGFPTANLDVGCQIVPAAGVYAGRTSLDGRDYACAISIGTMPTFGEHTPQIEVHLIGFTGDLYGLSLDVDVLAWMRDQRRFSSPDALKAQLQGDILAASGHAGGRR